VDLRQSFSLKGAHTRAKRRVFLSYHHTREQTVVDEFIEEFSGEYEVFTDMSLERAAESDDVDYLAQVCREAIKGTSVTIVMIGKRTGERKFVDWEIYDTLKMKHCLVAISRPDLAAEDASLPDRLKDNWKSGYAKWYSYPENAAQLKRRIDEAFVADESNIDNTRPLMKRNRST
jgi:Thoeris protein ThsB, TIR-like domain